jgi:TRAP-type C4-dicarboxylate transport system permease small subunit
LDQAVGSLSKIFLYISAVCLFIMSLTMAADVICRYFFNNAITGAQEIVQFSMSAFVFTGLGIAARKKAFTIVPLFLEMMSPWTRLRVEGASGLLCSFVSVLYTWKLGQNAAKYFTKAAAISSTLKIPTAPFYLLASVCCALMTLEFIFRAVADFKEAGQKYQLTQSGALQVDSGKGAAE